MKILKLLVLVFMLNAINIQAQITQSIGSPNFDQWEGISKVKNNTAFIENESTISYTYQNTENSFKGYRNYYSGSDWSQYEGLSFELFQKVEGATEVEISFYVGEENTRKLQSESKATIQLYGSGWQNIYVPWKMFNLPEGRGGTLQGVKDLKIAIKSDNNKQLQLRNITLKKGHYISLQAPVKGLATEAGQKVKYTIEVGNTALQTQQIQLSIPTVGWESMQASVHPATLSLKPGEIKTCILEVSTPGSLPQGTREKQVIKAIANGNGSASQSIEFTTAITVPSPFIVHTAENWAKVIDKIEHYDWAKEELAKYEAEAKKWKVPEYTTAKPAHDVFRGKHLFHHSEGDKMMNCALAYRLTGNKEYAKKCVEFLLKLSDEEKGYPVTYRVNQNNSVKEGGVFQNVARGYDMVKDCGLLSESDIKQIENTFRLYVETAMIGNNNGAVNNWDLSELAGAFYSALVIQDWDLVDWTLNSPSGIYRQFTQGVMSDGWWYECAVGYNTWCASMFSEIAIAMRPWGENFVDAQLPIGTTPYFSLLPERMKPGLYGMNFDKWGAIHKPSVGIKDMWDALIPFLDYRGVIFAVNDATESFVTGEPYELAYYLYGDPEYAAVLNRGTKRNLIYGVPELPKVKSSKVSKSAYADNMGVVQLRSQAKDREQREQIQAVLHYGTFGGYHGHFDRTNFISMMRYGRSFYNPEMYWYGYKSYLYKFLVQNSVNKNMVVVDQKMQEPTESFRTLFYEGDLMQVAAVETNSRWSNPPYGGMIYDDKAHYTFAEKAWEEGRSLPIPDDAPEYSKLSGFTEPVLQRRLMVMMDDYVVLADYLKADEEHTFDWLFQMKGFKEIIADKADLTKHENQMTFDPLSSAQFTTDCNWYDTEGTSRTKFEMCFGEDCDLEGARMLNSEDGPLKIDVFTAWPKQNEIMIGTAPEGISVNSQLWYTAKADGEELLNDSTGAWILGSQNVVFNLEGKKELTLSTKLGGRAKNKTIFWGNAKLVLKDGSEVFLSSLDLKTNNIIPADAGKDYYGGPVKIGGEPMPFSTPAMPSNFKEAGEIVVDLSGMDVARFEAKIGADFPLGDESARRKTMAVRSEGKDARYLSVIEPFESESALDKVTATSANNLTVELKDGRIQEITILNLDDEKGDRIQVSVKEYLNNKLIREEVSYQ